MSGLAPAWFDDGSRWTRLEDVPHRPDAIAAYGRPITHTHPEGGIMDYADAPQTSGNRRRQIIAGLGAERGMATDSDHEAPVDSEGPFVEHYTITAAAFGYQAGAFRCPDGTIVVRIGCELGTIGGWRDRDWSHLPVDQVRALAAFLDFLEAALAPVTTEEYEAQHAQNRRKNLERTERELEEALSRLEEVRRELAGNGGLVPGAVIPL